MSVSVRRGRGPVGDPGSIAPLVPIMGLMTLLLGGVVIDGSRLLNARGRAVAYAEEAARAGASAVVPGADVLALDEAVVVQRVEDYCASLQRDPELRSSIQSCGLDVDMATDQGIEMVGNGDSRRIVVRVRVSMRIQTSLIGILGVDDLTARGISRARPFEGTNPDDVDSNPPPVDPAPDSPVGPPGEVGVGDGPPEVDPGVPLCAPGAPPGSPGCTPVCLPGGTAGTPTCLSPSPSTAPPAVPTPSTPASPRSLTPSVLASTPAAVPGRP